MSEPISKKYQRFILGGITRTLLSRSFSLIYVILVTRLIIGSIMDQMIIFASGHLLIIHFVSFGMRYACEQRFLSSKDVKRALIIRSNSVLFFLIFSIPFSIILSIILVIYVTGFSSVELFFAYPLSLVFLVIMQIEVLIEKTRLEINRALFLNLFYSISNSILVPVFFVLVPTLPGVIWTWNICLLLTILLDIRLIRKVLKEESFDFPTIKYLIRFGFPIFIAGLPRQFSTNINRFIIFQFLAEGATALFYWPNRILSITNEVIMSLLSGTRELFTKMTILNEKRLYQSFLGFFRVITIISISFYLWIYINAQFFINILLGSNYLEAIPLFQLLCFAWIFQSPILALTYLTEAQAKRNIILTLNYFQFTIKIVFLIIFLQFGLVGIVLVDLIVNMFHFGYLIYKTPLMHKNDNFGRLILFSVLVIASALILNHIANLDFVFLVLINLLFPFIALIIVLITRPLTDIDMGYVEKIVPKEFHRLFSIYKPSNSIHTR